MSAGTGASDGASDTVWFISHASADRAWAEWIAWQLEEAGHPVELGYWDWAAGDNLVLKMNAALERGRLLALFSPAYFELDRPPEWTAVLARKDKIVPVRIAEATPPAILSSLLAPDLFGLDDHDARQVLLRAVNGPTRPDTPPPHPQGMRAQAGGESGPRLPESLPEVWNVPPRNAAFTGRDTVLAHLRHQLVEAGRVPVHAVPREGVSGRKSIVTRRQLTDNQWKLIAPFLPTGEHDPYPERLRNQFEGGDLAVPYQQPVAGDARRVRPVADCLRPLPSMTGGWRLHRTTRRPDL